MMSQSEMISFKAADYKFDANILLQEPAKNGRRNDFEMFFLMTF